MIKGANKRLLGLDIVKGLAVVLMIIYHFFFDLDYFRHVSIDFFSLFWQSFRYLIIGLFLFSMGVSLVLSHPAAININKVIKRAIVLGIAALLVSIMSYYLFPNSWIYFGILHFIWLASILALAVLFRPKTALVLAILIWSAFFLGFNDNVWLSMLKPALLPNYTQDFVPIFPWLAVVFIAVAIARLGGHRLIFSQQIWMEKTWMGKTFAFLGRQALWVYLTHQIILFGGFYLLEMV